MKVLPTLAALATFGLLVCLPVSSVSKVPVDPPKNADEPITQVPKSPLPPAVPDADPTPLLLASREFGAKHLLYELTENPEDNVASSPISFLLAFGMLQVGAEGASAKEIQKVMFGDQPFEKIRAAAANFQREAAQHENVLRIANGAFIAEKFPIKEDYLADLRKSFAADIQNTTFPNPGLGLVNEWVKARTNNRIPELFDDLSAEAVLVLANALWFKDAWRLPFEPELTKDQEFKLGRGRAAQVKMMNHPEVDVPYAEGPTWQAIQKFYETNFSMVILLPKPGTTPLQLVKDGTFAKQLGADFRFRLGQVSLPKWKFEGSYSMGDTLQKWGMKSPFKPSQDFRQIGEDPRGLNISQVIHKTFIEVTERGTEAAAATGIEDEAGASPFEPPKPFVFIADRPFLYAILTPSGVPIMVGCVQDPR